MNDTRIGFIGGGNMATSLVGGLIADGWGTDLIYIAEPEEKRRAEIRSRFPVHTGQDNAEVIRQVDVVVLAVKPQIMREVTHGLAAAVQEQQPLVISIAAGIRLGDLARWLGGYSRLVRCMPNTPALVQSGATGLYADPSVSETHRNLAESILRAVGLTLWLDNEVQLDAVTALSGSGPAYIFYIMEAMEKAAVELGLSPESARLLTLQTTFGAAKMALESRDGPGELRRRVTSPGGTTERAIATLEEAQLHRIFQQAIQGACTRAAELAEQLGSEQ
jgi:pyrroline-5-carboxylate reductase